MKLTTMTILISLFSCYQIAKVAFQIRTRALGLRSAFMWAILWASIGLGSLFPSTLDRFMRIAQMGDRMFFVLLLAVFVLFALVFNLASRIEKDQKDIARLVQEIALLRYRAGDGGKLDTTAAQANHDKTGTKTLW